MKGQGRTGRMWLAPVALAAPFLIGLGYAVIVYGGKIKDLLAVAVKVAVIP